MKTFRSLSMVVGLLAQSAVVCADAHDDDYLAGYATGILNHELKLNLPALVVKDGVITLPIGHLNQDKQTQAAHVLSEIPGVKAVKLAPSVAQSSDSDGETAKVNPAAVAGSAPASVILPTGLLPVGLLFKPFLADPRWAHFSVAYHNYQSNGFTGRNTAAVSFGETMPFYRTNLGQSRVQLEMGMQAGVFSDFDMDTASKNLVNSDFTVAMYSSIRSGRFSALGRFYHQSSHVGDEFLIAEFQQKANFQRVNLSYEALDLKLSYELPYGMRVYGGGSGFVDKDPSNLKTWSTQYGLEFRSPWIIDMAAMRPIIAADVKNFQETNWNTTLSVRAGVEFDSIGVWGRKLQLLAEYFDGYTPIGQFYKEKVQYVGLGVHFHF